MEITKEHVGRKVVLRNGQQSTITGFDSGYTYPVLILDNNTRTNTGLVWRGQTSPLDIVKFLEEPADLTQLDKPYGLLDSETQKALEAHGGPYLIFNGSRWEKRDFLDLFISVMTYRAVPQPEKHETFLNLHLSGEVARHSSEATALQYSSANKDNRTVKITWDEEGNVDLEKIE